MTYPDINPVAIEVGAIKIYWYGLMYLFGFAAAWLLARSRAEQKGFTKSEIEDLLFYSAVGVILGGRLGYAIFYDLAANLDNPINMLKIWQGGMSFHGGLIGVLVALWLYGRKTNRHFFEIADFVAPMVPLGLFFGRIGNFINGELWGKTTDLPWGMVFPGAGPLARHPSQLYQALLEGLLLFFILWWFSAKPRPRAAISGLFLLGYGCFRFIVELVRVPDAQYGYLAFNWFTMGQLLCVPMILAGLGLMIWSTRQHADK